MAWKGSFTSAYTMVPDTVGVGPPSSPRTGLYHAHTKRGGTASKPP